MGRHWKSFGMNLGKNWKNLFKFKLKNLILTKKLEEYENGYS